MRKSRSSPRKAPAKRARAKREPLGRTAWLEAARDALIEEGTAGVEVKKLSRRLRSSRGGFYWFFTSRQNLLDELGAYWAETSMAPFEKILQASGSGMDKLAALTDLWIEERDYDPRWDGAVRDWARTSAAVHDIVAAVDSRRIAILEQIFNEMGYRGKDAHIRARITYYHQVGYYAIGVRESRQERRELLPWYQKVLAGRGS
jgi:AcrR family transcriptional regulator